MIEKTKEFFELRKQIKFLQNQKGEGTELISVYIPSGSNVAEVANRLRDEYGQAMNIKSKKTRKNVQAAIDRILQTLKGVNKPPENGVAIFCGNIDGKIELFNVVPPEPIQVQLYRCDSSFMLEPLIDIITPKETYGLFTMDRREATFALLRGKNVRIMQHITSRVPGKHRKGGQSAQRFERYIELAAHEFYKRVAERADSFFKDPEVKAVILGGPGPTKDSFLRGDYLKPDIKKKIVGMIDTSYTDESGIKEMVNRSWSVIKKLDITKEKDLVNDFMEKVASKGLATYGEKEVEQALKNGQVHLLLLSEDLESEKLKKFSDLAEKTSAEFELISTETPEGIQFLKAFHGIGAILRYKM